MQNSKRLFDCLEVALQDFPRDDMFAAKEENGVWKKYSTQEVKDLSLIHI